MYHPSISEEEKKKNLRNENEIAVEKAAWFHNQHTVIVDSETTYIRIQD